MPLSEWREFPSAPCLAEKKNLMTARVSMLKSRASLTCFRACFLPVRAKDLSAPGTKIPWWWHLWCVETCCRIDSVGMKQCMHSWFDIHASVHRSHNFNFNYNQQHATILIYLFLISSTGFRRFLRPSSAAHNCTPSFRCCQKILLLAGAVAKMELWLRLNCGWYRGWDGTVAGTVAEMELWLVPWLRWNCGWDWTVVGIVAEMELWLVSWLRLNCGWYRGWDGTVAGTVAEMEL